MIDSATSIIYESEIKSYVYQKLARIYDGEYVTEKVIISKRQSRSAGKMTLCRR